MEIFIYKDFKNRTCQEVSVVNSTRVHVCIGYHLPSANENLCLNDGVEKVVGWSPLMWKRRSPELYPPISPTLSFFINSSDRSMLEDESMLGELHTKILLTEL